MIRCIKFRRYERNTLKGFCDIELVRTGLVIRDCTLHEKAGKEWIGFPARSYQGDDGTVRWQPLVEFSPNAAQARAQFQHEAVAGRRVAPPTSRREPMLRHRRYACANENTRAP